MKRIILFALAITIYLSLSSLSIWALPEGAVARLGKGIISGEDRAIVFFPDGSMLAVATSTGVYLYNPSTFAEVSFFETNAGVTSISFTDNGKLLAGGSLDDTVKLWNVASQQEVATLRVHYS